MGVQMRHFGANAPNLETLVGKICIGPESEHVLRTDIL